MEVPAKLYHAAPECAFEGIITEGLKSHWGEIYAAESAGHALTFMWFRLLDHFHPEQKLVIDGHEVPNLVAHSGIYVFEIDTTKTDQSLWDLGSDHSAAFFGADTTSWVYAAKQIPTSAINYLSSSFFSREVIEEATASKQR